MEGERGGKYCPPIYYSIRSCDLKGLTDADGRPLKSQRPRTSWEKRRRRRRPSLKGTERNEGHNHHATVGPEFNLRGEIYA